MGNNRAISIPVRIGSPHDSRYSIDESHKRFCKEEYVLLKSNAVMGDILSWNEYVNSHAEQYHFIELFGALLEKLDLQGVNLQNAYLEESFLIESNLSNGNFTYSLLNHAKLHNSILNSTLFNQTCLESAEPIGASLKGAKFIRAKLQGAVFRNAIVDGSTQFDECYVSKETDFRGVAIDACRIDPGTKALLKCNIRRKNWEDWYETHPRLKYLVKPFWWISDYGKSPKNLFISFFSISGISALIYCICGLLCKPGIVSNVFNTSYFPDNYILTFFKTWFFSIVTMVSLGGYSYLKPITGWGHLFVSLQLIIGYVILGALVTYLGILYNSDGPAGKYADEIEREKQRAAKWQAIKTALNKPIRYIVGTLTRKPNHDRDNS